MRTLKGRMTDLIATVLVLSMLAGWFLVGNTVEERMISGKEDHSRLAILAGSCRSGTQGLVERRPMES